MNMEWIGAYSEALWIWTNTCIAWVKKNPVGTLN